MATAADNQSRHDEITILARVLAKEHGKLPAKMARYILTLEFSDDDKARMHELAVRNQADGLTAGEQDELLAYAKAGDLLGILKSKARRALDIQLKKPTRS